MRSLPLVRDLIGLCGQIGGERADAMLKRMISTPHERTRNELGDREVFGEMALLDPAPRSASITALEDTHLLCLAHAPFYGAVDSRAEIARGVIRVLTRRGGVDGYRVALQNVTTGEQRHFADLDSLLAFWQDLVDAPESAVTSGGSDGYADES